MKNKSEDKKLRFGIDIPDTDPNKHNVVLVPAHAMISMAQLAQFKFKDTGKGIIVLDDINKFNDLNADQKKSIADLANQPDALPELNKTPVKAYEGNDLSNFDYKDGKANRRERRKQKRKK